MSKIKLVFLVVFLAIFIIGLIGYNSTPKKENSTSSSDTVNSNQTDSVNQITNVPSKTVSESEYTEMKIEYGENLCTDNEEVLLSFKMANSSKTLSICISKTQPDYIVYRFGTKDKIELEFPENKLDSWSKFTYSYYLRGGGSGNEGMDLNYLSFENGGFKYEIYQEFTAKDNITNIGIKVIDQVTNKETDIKGLSDSIEGSLINLRDNKKIKIEIL